VDVDRADDILVRARKRWEWAVFRSVREWCRWPPI
jgi:hypothetical protein